MIKLPLEATCTLDLQETGGGCALMTNQYFLFVGCCNLEEPYRKCSWTDGHVSTYHLVFFSCFLLYIDFVRIANNLTQHWCAWDHAACMCMGTPRTDWHVPVCAGVESRYLSFILAFNIHLTVL